MAEPRNAAPNRGILKCARLHRSGISPRLFLAARLITGRLSFQKIPSRSSCIPSIRMTAPTSGIVAMGRHPKAFTIADLGLPESEVGDLGRASLAPCAFAGAG